MDDLFLRIQQGQFKIDHQSTDDPVKLEVGENYLSKQAKHAIVSQLQTTYLKRGKMKKTPLLLFLSIACLFTLTACGPGQFKIHEQVDQYSSSKSHTILSENNRISSKSVAGGTHIDNKGLYMNPFAVKDENGKVELVGFQIENRSGFDSASGGVNLFGGIGSVVFRLSDGSLIGLDLSRQHVVKGDTIGYNNVTKTAGISVKETAVGTVTPAEFGRLASAETFSCMVRGRSQSAEYTTKDISPVFLQNIRTFYAQVVK